MAARILLLAGDNSPEREISLRSGEAVAAALRKAGYAVETADPSVELEKLLPTMRSADVVFPVLHGAGGEGGELQRFLEDNGIKFIGSDSKSSALCMDKARYATLLGEHDILIPQTELVNSDEYAVSALAKEPFVLKPNDGGSSIDTIIVRSVDQRDETAIEQAFGRHPRLLLQQLITGVEITIAVVGDESLPVIEIVPPNDQEFDYQNKYNGATREICPPEHVSQTTQIAAQRLAERIHKLCGCRDMSRTDIIIDKAGQLYVLETNTIPGLTDQSLLPKAAATAGLGMTELYDRLVRNALARS